MHIKINKKQPKLLSNKKSKIKFWRRTILTVSFLIVLLYAISFWSSHQSIEIQNVKIEGVEFADQNQIMQIFEEETQGKYLGLISKKNFLFLPKGVIEKRIGNMLSVNSVYIRIPNVNLAEIVVAEHKPVSVWCSIENVNDCYFVNKNGLLFTKLPELYMDNMFSLEGGIIEQENDKSKKIIKNKETETNLGKYFTSVDTFKKITAFIDLLNAQQDIFIIKVVTEDHETFTLHTTAGPTILIEKNDNPVEAVNNLESTLVQESIHDIQFANLEYIDLRFNDKVYYKIK
jgi:hypothetical protein